MKKQIELARRMFGMAPDIFSRCSAHMEWRCLIAFYGLLALHGLSALSIGLGLYATFQHPVVFLFAAVLFAALFTVDRLLIVGRRHWTSVLFRFFLVISLPVLNAGFFDLFAFEKDLRNRHEMKQQNLVVQEQGPILGQIRDNQERQDELYAKQSSLTDSLRIWERERVEEATGEDGSGEKGKGNYFELQTERLNRLRPGVEAQIAELGQRIARLEDERSGLDAALAERAEQRKPYEDLGLADRLELLGEKLLSNDQWFVRLISAMYLLLFVAFDGILLLPAVVAPFDEYRSKAALRIRHLAAVQEFRDTQWRQYSAAEVQQEIERKLFALEQEAEVDRIREVLKGIEERFRQEIALIEKLRAEESRKGAEWQHVYQKMLQVSVLRAVDAFEAAQESAG